MVNVSADVDIDVLNINKVEPVKRDTCLKNNKVRFKYSLKHIFGNISKTVHRSSKFFFKMPPLLTPCLEITSFK